MDISTLGGITFPFCIVGGILAYIGFLGHIVKMSTYHHMIHFWKGTPEEVLKQRRSAERFKYLMCVGLVIFVPAFILLVVIGTTHEIYTSFSDASPSPWETLWGVMNLVCLFALTVTLIYVVITWSNHHFGLKS